LGPAGTPESIANGIEANSATLFAGFGNIIPAVSKPLARRGSL
jgi:hypothetical protein